MANEFSADDPIEVWQSQPVEPVYMSIEEIRNKAMKFGSTIQRRNLRETIVAVALIPVFGLFLRWFPTPVERVGSCLTIAGLLYVIYRMNGSAAPKSVPSSGGFDTCVSFHRRELERQRDLLRGIWLWYLAPLVPGILVFNLGVIGQKISPGHPLQWWRAAPFVVLMVAWFWVVIWLNRRAAQGLQRTIEELDRVAEQ